MNSSHQADILSECYKLVQAFADLEVLLDDVFVMGVSQRKCLASKIKQYPTYLGGKLKKLPVLAEVFGDVLSEEIISFCESASVDLETPLACRQLVVHGRLYEARSTYQGLELMFVKHSLPVKEDGRQLLNRKTAIRLLLAEVRDARTPVRKARERMQQIYFKLFHAGNGWPDFMPQQEAPLLFPSTSET